MVSAAPARVLKMSREGATGRRFALLTLAAITMVACGGGGSLVPSSPASSPTSPRGARSAAAEQFCQHLNGSANNAINTFIDSSSTESDAFSAIDGALADLRGDEQAQDPDVSRYATDIANGFTSFKGAIRTYGYDNAVNEHSDIVTGPIQEVPSSFCS